MVEVEFSDLFQEAKRYYLDGNNGAAENLLNQLLLRDARNPEVYQILATLYYDSGQFNKAIKTFKKALEIDPSYTEASVGLSIILNDLGRYDEGRRIFLEAEQRLERRNRGKEDLWLNEKLASKHEELADLYFQYERYTEALEQLFKAQRLSTRRPEISMRIADCYVRLGDLERAIKDLRTLIRDYPQWTAARLKLGSVYYNNNHLAEATEMWESVLARDPKNVEAAKGLKMAQAAAITSLVSPIGSSAMGSSVPGKGGVDASRPR